MKTLMITLLLFISSFCFANDNVVNVYNWTGYMPPQVLEQFTEQTGIKVNFSTFASNDELFAKIATTNGDSGYDIIVPSANFVTRMKELGMLEKLDHHKIIGMNNLNPSLLNKAFDPNNQYSLPYLWGITGIVINRRYYPHLNLDYWRDLWDPKLKNQILMLDETKEPFEIALKVLGYPANTRNPQQIKAAYEKLLQLLPNIKLFNITAPQSIIANGDVGIGVIYNGDAFPITQDNPNLDFFFPKDGAFVWIDNLAIVKNAPHLANAYKFINFVLQPKIAAEIAEFSGYSSPNSAGIKLLPKAARTSKILYPGKDILDKASFEKDAGPANALYQHYWFLLKLNGS